MVFDERSEAAKKWAMVVYVLQAASFFLGVTFIIAVVVNYLKKGDVEGTWVSSHFRWQIRTFWFSVLWGTIGFLTIILLVGYVILGVSSIWLIYRIAKGWIYLSDGKLMYV